MQTVKPAKDQLFCKPEEAQKQTSSGILLTDNVLEKPKIAEVINVGSSVTQFKPKERIIYKQYATTDIKVNEDDYFLISEEDVLGTVVEVDG